MPKPADIIRHIDGDSENNAYKAWSKVESAIQHIGSYETIIFDDPIIHCVIVDMGGWTKLCSTLSKEMPFKTGEFVKRYRGYLRKKPEKFHNKLIGKFEQHNHVNRYGDQFIDSPVVVKEIQLAIEIYKQGKTESGLKVARNHDAFKNLPKREEQDSCLKLEDRENNEDS